MCIQYVFILKSLFLRKYDYDFIIFRFIECFFVTRVLLLKELEFSFELHFNYTILIDFSLFAWLDSNYSNFYEYMPRKVKKIHIETV